MKTTTTQIVKILREALTLSTMMDLREELENYVADSAILRDAGQSDRSDTLRLQVVAAILEGIEKD